MEGRAYSAHQVYVRYGGTQRGAAPGDAALVSRAAHRLHVLAVLASIEAGRPGLITDAYLGAIAEDTSVAALELCTAELWSRVEGGYVADGSEVLRMAGEVHRQLEELAARCRASGGHVPDDEVPGTCRRCGVRLDPPS